MHITDNILYMQYRMAAVSLLAKPTKLFTTLSDKFKCKLNLNTK